MFETKGLAHGRFRLTKYMFCHSIYFKTIILLKENSKCNKNKVMNGPVSAKRFTPVVPKIVLTCSVFFAL